MSNELNEFMRSQQYLPEFMRGFHAQKELFKTIPMNDGCKDMTWVQAHIYTIDCFLWFMARRGYTLQRNRRRLPFLDLQTDLATGRNVRALHLPDQPTKDIKETV